MGNAALSAKLSFFGKVNVNAASYMPVFDWPNYLIHRILFLIAIIKRTILEHFFLEQLYMIKYSALKKRRKGRAIFSALECWQVAFKDPSVSIFS